MIKGSFVRLIDLVWDITNDDPSIKINLPTPGAVAVSEQTMELVNSGNAVWATSSEYKVCSDTIADFNQMIIILFSSNNTIVTISNLNYQENGELDSTIVISYIRAKTITFNLNRPNSIDEIKKLFNIIKSSPNGMPQC